MPRVGGQSLMAIDHPATQLNKFLSTIDASLHQAVLAKAVCGQASVSISSDGVLRDVCLSVSRCDLADLPVVLADIERAWLLAWTGLSAHYCGRGTVAGVELLALESGHLSTQEIPGIRRAVPDPPVRRRRPFSLCDETIQSRFSTAFCRGLKSVHRLPDAQLRTTVNQPWSTVAAIDDWDPGQIESLWYRLPSTPVTGGFLAARHNGFGLHTITACPPDSGSTGWDALGIVSELFDLFASASMFVNGCSQEVTP